MLYRIYNILELLLCSPVLREGAPGKPDFATWAPLGLHLALQTGLLALLDLHLALQTGVQAPLGLHLALQTGLQAPIGLHFALQTGLQVPLGSHFAIQTGLQTPLKLHFVKEDATYEKPNKTIGFYMFFALPHLCARFYNL